MIFDQFRESIIQSSSAALGAALVPTYLRRARIARNVSWLNWVAQTRLVSVATNFVWPGNSQRSLRNH